jgi:hypothetical protein
LTIDTGNMVSNGGTMEATNTGGLLIDDAVTNSGIIAADGGVVAIVGDPSGAGKGQAEIFSGNTIELKGALDTGAVSFQNNGGTDNGVLVLDFAATTGVTNGFRGTIAGFFNDGTNSDTLDLKDIKSGGSETWSFKQSTATKGVLTVNDGVGDIATISLLGGYLAAGKSANSGSSTLFALAADNGGGWAGHIGHHEPRVTPPRGRAQEAREAGNGRTGRAVPCAPRRAHQARPEPRLRSYCASAVRGGFAGSAGCVGPRSDE